MSAQEHQPGRVALSVALFLLLVACSRNSHGGRVDLLPPPPPQPIAQTDLAQAGAPAHGDAEQCANAGCIPPGPIPAGATCVELVNHDPKDRAAPYMASADEGVTCFYYDAPWRESSVLVAWQTAAGQVMDEWQLFSNAGEQADGAVSGCAPSSAYGAGQLLMAHPRGSNDVLMPARTGLRLPGPGSRLMLQWHYNNDVGVPTPDRSVVRLCTMPTSMVPNVAGLTVLGSENAAQGVPPGRSSVEGSCLLEPEDPVVRLLMLAPHMHARGRRVVMRVERANGGVQRVLDLDFDSEEQLMRATNVTLRPGDRLVTSCTYENNGSTVIPFGASLYNEQCYVFAVSQPAGALDRTSTSPLAANTCL